MKKNLIISGGIILSVLLLFSACQKEIKEKTVDPEIQSQSKDGHDDDKNECRLRHIEQGWAGPVMDFHYNHKGLADKWLIDYGGGNYEEHQIKYDHQDRIKSTRIIAPVLVPGDAINYNFYSNGNLTTRATGYLESGPIWADIFYSYNRKGQMTREDDNVNDYHIRFYYDNKGFNIKTDFYIGADLYVVILWKYDIPNRNPFLSVNGVNYGFPFYTWPLYDKRFNSSWTVILYEEGTPIVIAEDDPAQTVIQTGTNHYVTKAHYYDITTEQPYDIIFTYQNCGDRDDDNSGETAAPSSAKKVGPLSVRNRLNQILSWHSKNMKQELKDFKK